MSLSQGSENASVRDRNSQTRRTQENSKESSYRKIQTVCRNKVFCSDIQGFVIESNVALIVEKDQ